MQYILVGYTDVPTKNIDETPLWVGDWGYANYFLRAFRPYLLIKY